MNIKRPIGITIISILIILNGSFLLFSGIVTFFLASNFAAHLDTLDLSSLMLAETNNTILSNNDPNIVKNFSYFLYLIAGIITLFSLIHFIIAYGLLKGKSWARLTTLIISIISSNNFARMGLTKFSRYDNSFCLGSSSTLIGALNKNKLKR